VSYEADLLALAVLLYLYDSSVLLYANEGVLTRDRRGGWWANSGWTGFVLAGRSLCMLNPFTPHHASFRLQWDFKVLPAGDPGWAELAPAVIPLGPSMLTAAVALFVMLPLGLLTALGAYAVIPAVVLLYGSIGWGLIGVYRRKILVVRNRRFLGFAFECLACPPFGVNMIRRITLADRITEPLPVAGARLLDAGQWSELRTRCLARLDEMGRLDSDDGAVRAELDAQKDRLGALDRPR
jgi:hypothetical protein